MGLWDDMTGLLRRGRDKAAKEAGKAAARKAVQEAGERVQAAGDELLDDAEAELERAKKAREGRDESWRPNHDSSDAIAQQIESAVTTAQSRSDGDASTAEDREARAREELERMKAELKASVKDYDNS